MRYNAYNKVRVLYYTLKSLGLEKFATPLMEFYDFEKKPNKQNSIEEVNYRFKKELNKDFNKYQEYSQKIIDNFSIIYPSKLFEKLYKTYFGSTEVLIFANAEDLKYKLLNRYNFDISKAKKFDNVNGLDIIDEFAERIKNTTKYDYNIIVLSEALPGDNYSPEWLLHDILGHTISLTTKQIQRNSTLTIDFLNILTNKALDPYSKDLFRKFRGAKTRAYISNHLNIIKTIDFKKYSKDDIDEQALNIITLKERLITEININFDIYISSPLMYKIDEICSATSDLGNFLKDIGAMEQSNLIPDANSGLKQNEKIAYEDVIPTIFAAYLGDKSKIRKAIINFIEDSGAKFKKMSENEKIIFEVKKSYENLFTSGVKEYIYKIVKEIISKYITNPIDNCDIFISEDIIKLLTNINVQELIKIYIDEASEVFSVDNRMYLIDSKLQDIDKSLSILEGAYAICNMTSF